MTENRQFHQFIIITITLPLEHDSGIRRNTLQETPLLDDLRALVEFAQAGSIARAADRLFRDALGDYPASAKAGGCIGC